MRLMRFTHTISCFPGKQLVIFDALSRAPVTPSSTDDKFRAEIDAYVNLMIQSTSTMKSRLKIIKSAQRMKCVKYFFIIAKKAGQISTKFQDQFVLT